MVMEEQESEMELASERIPVPQVQQPKLGIIKQNNKSGISRGKPRLRKKALHAAILKQMEFYFSDANLNKDRYLSELVKKNPYVELEIFTNFNKLSVLTTDIDRIAKALQRSTILKLSEDGTKVCRLTPINKKENTDECTIYVQNLPSDADHDWIISVFSKYGPVVYVSIPRYKSNKKIKGFAFVEFDTPMDAKECIKAFQEKGCVLPSHSSPNDLLSITTFNNPEKDITLYPKQGYLGQCSSKKIIETNEINETNKKQEISDGLKINDNNEIMNNELGNNIRQTLGKRKLTEKSSVSNESDNKVKKRKIIPNQNIVDQQNNKNSNTENQEISNKNIINCDKIVETDKKKKRKLVINDIPVVEDISGKKESITKKSRESTIKSDKKKVEVEILNKNNNANEQIIAMLQTENHYPILKDVNIVTSSNIEEKQTGAEEKKKKKNRKKRSKIQEDVIYNAVGLQVMAKRDWKCLRNKYLELQKSKMRQLKLHLKKTRWNYDKAGQNYDKSRYGKDNGKTVEVEKSCYGNVTYTPGIIVKIEMDEPCADSQSFKIELKDNNYIKYIDVTDGSCEAYVRCDTAETAQIFIQKNFKGRRLTILKDNEEKLYWDKIEHDRKEKLGNKKRFKQRGRDKLLKRAEKELGKCIKFDQV